MEIKVTKEIKINGTELYCIYLDNKFHTSFFTEECAMDEVKKIRKTKKSSTEVIHTETI